MPQDQQKRQPAVQPSRDDLIYAAGLFDGEGCIQFGRRGKWGAGVYELMVQVQMANREAVAWLGERFAGRVYAYETGQHFRRDLPMHRWIASCKQAEQFLYAVIPWLRVKRAEAQMALGFRLTFHFTLDERLRQEREVYVKCAAWLKRLAVGRADPNEVEREYGQGPGNSGQ